MKEEKIYRIFLTRLSEKRARSKAERYIRKAKPDVRAIATDNGWHGDEGVELKCIGQFGKNLESTHSMREANKNVFVCVE